MNNCECTTSAELLKNYNDAEIREILATKENKMPIVTISDSEVTISAELNTLYRMSTVVNSLSVELPKPQDVEKVYNVVLYFKTGDSPTSTITCDDASVSVHYLYNYEIDKNITYEVNCMWNGSAWIILNAMIEI